MKSPLVALALISFLSAAQPSAPAPVGPPLVCHELAIDGARSLPWGKGFEAGERYDRTKLVGDVAKLLETETDLVVRMETLRRAAIYARGDRALAWELLGRTGLMVLEQESIGAKCSTTWFDAGVLVACWKQLDFDFGFHAGVADGIEGYGYFAKALECARAEKNDQIATIHFAAALCAHPAMRPDGGSQRDLDRYWGHIDEARKASASTPLLAKNLDTHVANWKDYVRRKRS